MLFGADRKARLREHEAEGRNRRRLHADDVLTHDAHQRDTTLHSMLAAMKYPDHPSTRLGCNPPSRTPRPRPRVARQVEEVKAQSNHPFGGRKLRIRARLGRSSNGRQRGRKTDHETRTKLRDGRPDHGKLRDESLRGRRPDHVRDAAVRPQVLPKDSATPGRMQQIQRMQSRRMQLRKAQRSYRRREFRQDADAEGSLFRKGVNPGGCCPEILYQFNRAAGISGCFLFQGISPVSGNQNAAYAGSDSRHMGEGPRSVRKNRSRVRTASIARRRFMSGRSLLPPPPQSHKRQEACLHTVCPCVVDRFSVREAWCR